MGSIKVLMVGATGKTGAEVTRALLQAEDLSLVGAVARRTAGQDIGQVLGMGPAGVRVQESFEEALESSQPDVMVDFTSPSLAGRHALAAARRRVHPIIGTTGLDPDELGELHSICKEHSLGGVVSPNFSLGATVLMRLVQQAARVFKEVEIIEGHHRAKLDAPSGTALRIKDRVAGAMGKEEIPIHSLRLSGLVADHEVIFSSAGETLSVRHGTVSRQAFAPGVLLAVRKVGRLKEVIFDLDTLFDL